MIKKEILDALTLEIREILDPVVIEAGYSPEDYKIVWEPLESMNHLHIDLEELKKAIMDRDPHKGQERQKDEI